MKTRRSLHLCVALAVMTAVAPVKAQAPPRVPPGVKALRDLAYVAGGHERQKLDLYLPEKTADRPLPLVIWVHGGGWQAGSKDSCPALRSGFIDRGYAVASIGYRLSDAAVFPAQIEDCKAAIRWLRAHAQEYQLDPQRFGVWGSSAGGHLVALLGTSGDVQALDVGPNLDQTSRVQAVCDFFGPTDFSVFVSTPGYERHATADSPEAKLIGGQVSENKEKAARANSITYVTKDDPAFLIVHGDSDRTVPINQSELLFEALKKAGGSAHLHTIHGAGHGGPGFSDKVVADMVNAFFDQHLKAGSTAVEIVRTESAIDPAAATQKPAGSPPSAAGRKRPSWEMILAHDDKNKDGKVAKDEFTGPPPLFERLDRNHDGVITREEVEALPPSPQ